MSPVGRPGVLPRTDITFSIWRARWLSLARSYEFAAQLLVSTSGRRHSSRHEGKRARKRNTEMRLAQAGTNFEYSMGRYRDKALLDETALHSRCLKGSANCGAEQPTGSLSREREIAAISTLVFDSCRSRCPS